MYNFIGKDVVIEVIQWLKANNPLYNQVMLNDMWLDDWSNSEFSSFLQIESEGECIDSPAHCDTNNSHSEDITCC